MPCANYPSPSAVLDALLQAIKARSLPATLVCFALQADPAVLGSERGELARGQEAVEAFFERICGSSGAYQFDLPNRVLATHGDVAWMVAEGTVVEPTGAAAKPYRLTAVFIRSDIGWRISLWSGSSLSVLEGPVGTFRLPRPPFELRLVWGRIMWRSVARSAWLRCLGTPSAAR